MKSNKPQRDYIRAFFRGNRLNYILTLALTLLVGTINIAASWLLGAVTDCMTTGNLDRLVQIAWIVAALIACIVLVIWCYGRVKARFIRRAMVQYKALAFSRLSSKSISAFTRENTSRYLSALTNDTNSIESQYLEYITDIVQECFSFVLALGMMLYYSPILTLVLILASALPLVVSLSMSGKYAELEKQVSDRNEVFTGRIKDLLSGFAVIKSFKAEQQTQQIFETDSAQLEQGKMKKRNFAAVVSAASIAAGFTAQMGTFLAGAFMAIRGDITPGTVLIFVNLCNSVLSPIKNVPTYWAGIQASLKLISKLAELTDKNAAHRGQAIPPVLNDAISFEQVSFGYDPNTPVLHNVDLRFEAGRKYAIVGASGSGKSTLLNLIMGGYDNYTGSLSIDGRELRDVDPDSLYDLMSLIGQNVFLFDATVRENITMFRKFPDAAVTHAAEMSGLDRVIASKGEDYCCGENGVGLSGGEKQRVSIARCLLSNTPVLMMDEATASLDNQTSFEVTDAILKLDGLTRIVVTHRLEEALLKQYDEIIVLRDGKVAEQGRFEALMEKAGYFYSLYHVTN